MDAVSQATEASDAAMSTGNNNLMALQQQMDQSFLNRGQHLEELAKEIEAKAKAAAEKVAANAAELRKVRGIPDDPVPPLACFEYSAPSEQPVDRSIDRGSHQHGRNQERNPSDTRGGLSRNRTRSPRHRNWSRNSTRTAKTYAEESRDGHGSSHRRGSRERSPPLHVESKVDDNSSDKTRRSKSKERGSGYGHDRGTRVSRRSRERSPDYNRRRRSRSRERRRRSRSRDRMSSRDHGCQTDRSKRSTEVEAETKIVDQRRRDFAGEKR